MDNRIEDLDWLLDKLGAAKKPEPIHIANKKSAEEFSGTRAKELDLWKTWKDNGHKPKDLAPLLHSINPVIQASVNKFKNRVEIPTSVIEQVHKKEAINALKDYDPKKGANLYTHLRNRLIKGTRFIETFKNAARTPEHISRHIGAFNALKSEIQDKLGHEPDDLTVHDHIATYGHPTLGLLSLKDIKRINKEQRKALIQTGSDNEEYGEAPNLSSRDEEVVHLIYQQLTPEERVVHEYTFGINGKAKLKPGAIAKKTGIHNTKVAKLRTSILKKMSPYLND